MIGDVDKDIQVQGLIKKYNIEDYVICTGKVLDVYKYYSAMDIFLFPSIYEGLSVSMVEAQAAGLNVIASENVSKESDVSGLVEFVKIDDAMKVANILWEKVKQRNDRDSVNIKKEYDLRVSAEKMLQLYELWNKE